MKIGLDVDNTITKFPKVFSELSYVVKKDGGQVHIVTSRSDDEIARVGTIKELKEYNIIYDRLFFLPGYAQASLNCPHKELDWYQKYLWQKVDYCLKNTMDTFVDDDEKVISLFKTYAPSIKIFYPNESVEFHKKTRSTPFLRT